MGSVPVPCENGSAETTGHSKTPEQRTIIQQYWQLMGGLLQLVQRGWAWAGCVPVYLLNIIRCGTIIVSAL